MAIRSTLPQLLANLDKDDHRKRPRKTQKYISVELFHKEFAWQFLFGPRPFNATAAYQAAAKNRTYRRPRNVKKTSITTYGGVLLRHPFVQAELARLIAETRERKQLDQDMVIDHWVSMAERDVLDYFTADDKGILSLSFDLHAMPKKIRQNLKRMKLHKWKIGEIEHQIIDIEVVDKENALTNLAQFMGMFKGQAGAGIEDLTKAIREAEQRALTRSVVVDNDTGQVLEP